MSRVIQQHIENPPGELSFLGKIIHIQDLHFLKITGKPLQPWSNKRQAWAMQTAMSFKPFLGAKWETSAKGRNQWYVHWFALYIPGCPISFLIKAILRTSRHQKNHRSKKNMPQIGGLAFPGKQLKHTKTTVCDVFALWPWDAHHLAVVSFCWCRFTFPDQSKPSPNLRISPWLNLNLSLFANTLWLTRSH